MSDDNNKGGEGGETGKDGKPVVPATQPSVEFDTSKIPDEQFGKIFEDKRTFTHPRFKELTDAQKELKARKEADAKLEQDRLIKEKKFDEVLKQKDEEITGLKTRYQQAQINQAVAAEAIKRGAVDIDAVTKLINQSDVKLNEDGSITGVTEALDALVKDKGYLFKKTIKVGSGTNPSDADTGEEEFTMSQIQNPAFYRKNEAAIKKAISAGKIKEDRPGAR